MNHLDQDILAFAIKFSDPADAGDRPSSAGSSAAQAWTFSPVLGQRYGNGCIKLPREEQGEPAWCFLIMNELARGCLRKAAEGEHTALQTTDESARLLYLDLANHRRTLAEHVETMDRQRARFEQSEPKSEGT